MCIDLQVKYGKVCSLWYDAAGSSGIMGLTFSNSAHVTKVSCIFISLKTWFNCFVMKLFSQITIGTLEERAGPMINLHFYSLNSSWKKRWVCKTFSLQNEASLSKTSGNCFFQFADSFSSYVRWKVVFKACTFLCVQTSDTVLVTYKLTSVFGYF